MRALHEDSYLRFQRERSHEHESNLATSENRSRKMSDLKKARLWRRVRHEVWEMARVTINMLKGNGSKLSYLFIPAFISLLWLFIMLFTTRNPNVTLDERYIRVS